MKPDENLGYFPPMMRKQSFLFPEYLSIISYARNFELVMQLFTYVYKKNAQYVMSYPPSYLL